MQVKITELGGQGDGIAELSGGGKLFVPLALPGELVEVEAEDGRGELKKIVEPSAERIKPLCRHFAQCGGCALQHLRTDAYLDWKRQKVCDALRARGIDASVEPVVELEPGARRRAVLSATRTKKGVLLGYFRRTSHEIVDITECPVLTPQIVEALPGLRQLVRQVLTRKAIGRLTLVATMGGLDVSIEKGVSVEDAGLRATLAGEARRLKLARLTVNGETIVEHDRPVVLFGGIKAVAPPGGFLQASDAAQERMIEYVLQLAGEGGRAVDLFCGMGTFSLPLARRFKLLAVEYDELALAALKAAHDRDGSLKPVTCLSRDLFAMPLSAKELEDYYLVLFDPPRAGAKDQAQQLAASRVPRILAVSCNPASFARDARILMDGGYVLRTITPFDQFLFSPHVELVGLFER